MLSVYKAELDGGGVKATFEPMQSGFLIFFL